MAWTEKKNWSHVDVSLMKHSPVAISAHAVGTEMAWASILPEAVSVELAPILWRSGLVEPMERRLAIRLGALVAGLWEDLWMESFGLLVVHGVVEASAPVHRADGEAGQEQGGVETYKFQTRT